MSKQKKTSPEISTRDFAIQAAQLISDRHGEDIVLLDLREHSPVTDYFLIATGTSNRQVSSVADELKTLGKTQGHTLFKMAGRETGDWIVMDFVDLVVHLFTPELRTYYDLELIWGEAEHVELALQKGNAS